MLRAIANDGCVPNPSRDARLRFMCCAWILFLIPANLSIGKAPEPSASIPAPVLVELFTSEGCSTCPPADAMLEQMDKQPVPGANLIVLSEHVDYWNHDGWRDPYSSPSATERQNEYVRSLGLKTAYTPQIIIDGTSELQRGDPQQTKQLFEKVLAAPKIAVRISSLRAEVNGSVVRGHIEVDQNTGRHNADLYVAVALDHVESQVSAGENGGKRLSHVAVVQELKRIGKVEKGRSANQDFEFKLKAGAEPASVRIVAFVQEVGPARVVGAAIGRIGK
jgi:hypothetical protein